MVHRNNIRRLVYEISESALPDGTLRPLQLYYYCGLLEAGQRGPRGLCCKNDSACDLASLTSLLCFYMKKGEKKQ